MIHLKYFSGGIGSWAAAKRVAERHGTDDLVQQDNLTQLDLFEWGGCGCAVDG